MVLTVWAVSGHPFTGCFVFHRELLTYLATFGAMALSGVKAAEEALKIFDERKKQNEA